MPPSQNETITRSRNARLFSEQGSTGLAISNGRVNEEFVPALRHDRTVQTYKEMSSNDPIIGGFLHAINQCIRKISWTVKSTGTSLEDQRAAVFIASCFEDMSISWPDTLAEILSMLPYGWSYFEKVYKYRRGPSDDPTLRSRYNDGKIGIRKIAVRSQETLDSWSIDDEGGIQGMWQKRHPYSDSGPRHAGTGTRRGERSPGPTTDSGDPLGRVFIPIEKALLFRTFTQRNNPEGRSILRSAYRPWYIKKNIEDIMVIGVERDLVGLPVFKSPAVFDPIKNPIDRRMESDAKQILTNIRNDEQNGLIIPFGWEFELISSPGQRQFDLVEVLQYYDKRLAITVLGQFILLGMERVGSFALSKNSTNLFTLSLSAWISSIIDVMNKYVVKELLFLNGMEDMKNPPQLIAGRVEDYDLDVLGNYISRLAKVGAVTADDELEEFLRKAGGLAEVPDRSSVVRPANTSPPHRTPRRRAQGTGQSSGSNGSGQNPGSDGSNRVRTKTNLERRADTYGNLIDQKQNGQGNSPPGKITRSKIISLTGREVGVQGYVCGIDRSDGSTIHSRHETSKAGFESFQHLEHSAPDDVIFFGRDEGVYDNGDHAILVVLQSIPKKSIETNDAAWQAHVKAQAASFEIGALDLLDEHLLAA